MKYSLNYRRLNMNKRTAQCRNLAITFTVLNWVLCFGLAAALIIAFISGMDPAEPSLKEKFGTVVTGACASLIPMIVLSILVKDKIQPCVWMADIILANYMFGDIAMYITAGIWLIAEYVIRPLSRHYRTCYTVNKEIDRR